MAWIVLILSGLMESAWATALGRSKGLSELARTLALPPDRAARMRGS